MGAILLSLDGSTSINMLDLEAIAEFREIFCDEYGVLLNEAQASELANRTLNVFKLISQEKMTTPKSETNNVQLMKLSR